MTLTPEEIEKLAPPLVEWHEMYCRTMHMIFDQLGELQKHPAFKDAEDLGDWVETLHTLISFRPSTHDHIEAKVRKDLFG